MGLRGEYAPLAHSPSPLFSPVLTVLFFLVHNFKRSQKRSIALNLERGFMQLFLLQSKPCTMSYTQTDKQPRQNWNFMHWPHLNSEQPGIKLDVASVCLPAQTQFVYFLIAMCKQQQSIFETEHQTCTREPSLAFCLWCCSVYIDLSLPGIQSQIWSKFAATFKSRCFVNGKDLNGKGNYFPPYTHCLCWRI